MPVRAAAGGRLPSENLPDPDCPWRKPSGRKDLRQGIQPGFERVASQRDGGHEPNSFQEEYVEMLRKSGVEYDEKYLW